MNTTENHSGLHLVVDNTKKKEVDNRDVKKKLVWFKWCWEIATAIHAKNLCTGVNEHADQLLTKRDLNGLKQLQKDIEKAQHANRLRIVINNEF